MSLIQIKDVHKSYKTSSTTTEILKGLNLNIDQSEFVSITGTSGSGKSTLINILGLLDTIDGGSYLLNGTTVGDMSDDELAEYRLVHTGFIFQSFNLIESINVQENVMLPLVYNRILNKKQRIERSNEMLESVGIAEKRKSYPSELSGGQQQRVAIARALVNKPKVIFADEPTGNLDTASGNVIMDVLHKLHASGSTIVMVTHDLDLAGQTQRIIHVKDGVIVDNSVPAEQLQQNTSTGVNGAISQHDDTAKMDLGKPPQFTESIQEPVTDLSLDYSHISAPTPEKITSGSLDSQPLRPLGGNSNNYSKVIEENKAPETGVKTESKTSNQTIPNLLNTLVPAPGQMIKPSVTDSQNAEVQTGVEVTKKGPDDIS